MTNIRLNTFKRIAGKQSLYFLEDGQTPIFHKKIGLVPPHFKTSKAPDFGIISGKNWLSGFFLKSRGLYTGDQDGRLLILKMTADDFSSFILCDSGYSKIETYQWDKDKLQSIINQAIHELQPALS